VLGGIGTFAAWLSVVALHKEARTIGIPWMIIGMATYFIYRRRQGLDPFNSFKIQRANRPADFQALEYRTALVPIFGEDVSASALSSAARLIGPEGVVYAVFVLPVPAQLPLDGGMEAEEARGREVLETALISGRRLRIKVRTGLIRTRNAGAALVEEAVRLNSDVIYLSTLHAPANEQQLGRTASYLLDKRPCRIIIATDNRPRGVSDGEGLLIGAR
jgi:hypothetical protein